MAEQPPVVNILRDWMMRNPHAPQPSMVVVASPEVWERMQAEFRRVRDEPTYTEMLDWQRFDGLPIIVDPGAASGYCQVMPVEEYARRYPDSSSPKGETP